MQPLQKYYCCVNIDRRRSMQLDAAACSPLLPTQACGPECIGAYICTHACHAAFVHGPCSAITLSRFQRRADIDRSSVCREKLHALVRSYTSAGLALLHQIAAMLRGLLAAKGFAYIVFRAKALQLLVCICWVTRVIRLLTGSTAAYHCADAYKVCKICMWACVMCLKQANGLQAFQQ
jgi:hypothetical protein